jgi:hypothetical protein
MYENTAQDLRQVFEDMERRFYASTATQPEVDYETGEIEDDEDNALLSSREESARQNILQMCRDILEMYGDDEQ